MEEFPFTDYIIKTSGRGAARVCIYLRSVLLCVCQLTIFEKTPFLHKQLSLLQHSIELNFRSTTKKYHIAKL